MRREFVVTIEKPIGTTWEVVAFTDHQKARNYFMSLLYMKSSEPISVRIKEVS